MNGLFFSLKKRGVSYTQIFQQLFKMKRKKETEHAIK